MSCAVCRNGNLYTVFEQINLEHPITEDAAIAFESELRRRKDARYALDVVLDMMYRDCMNCEKRIKGADNIVTFPVSGYTAR